MTDKQIIIDGVDVSKCEFYSCGLCNIPDSIETFDSCMDKNPNCYYKQLKYLEKAFDHREKTYLTNLNNLADEAKFLREKLHNKEQECEELTTKCSQLEKENKILKNFLKEENCNFDKIKDLVND